MNRRNFLKLLPAMPFYKVAWPQAAAVADQFRQNQARPNILFLVFDTLSAKHVSLYGYDRETTPNLARIAAQATIFHDHRTTANFTSSATSSLLTGVNPWSHRAFHLHGTVAEEYVKKNIFSLLPNHYHKTAYTHNLLVASLLHQFRGDLDLFKQTRDLCLLDGEFADRVFFNDYSAAFWSEWLFLRGGASPPSSLFLSLADRGRRFLSKRELTKAYGDLFPRGIPGLHSLFFLLEDAIDWIGEQVMTMPQPFFGYFHLLPPHEPYTARRDFIDIFADGWQPIEKPPHFSSQDYSQKELNRQRREYDEYLAYTDSELGRLYDSLEQSGTLDNTYFIITSDHGELFERGIRGHVTLTLYDPLLHVPLLVVKPGQKERVDVFSRTSSLDLLPTLLHVTGESVPDWCEGEVLPTFGLGQGGNGRSLYALEAKSNAKQAPLTKATTTLTRDHYKLISYLGYGNHENEFELYNLVDDPEETRDLYSSEPAIAALLQEELEEKLQTVNKPYRRQ